MTDSAWTVLPHGPLHPVADGLWTLEGHLGGGMLPRTMSVVRFHHAPDASSSAAAPLLLHGPTAVDETTLARILEQGAPAFAIAASGWHRRQVEAWKERFPEVRVGCPPGAWQRVEELCPVDGTSAELLEPFGVRVLTPAGVATDRDGGAREQVLDVPAGTGRALLFGDLLFNVPHQPGFAGLLMRLFGSTGGPRVTPIARLLVVSDRRALGGWFAEQAARDDLRALVPAHGAPITDDAAGTLRRLADALG